MRARAVDHRPVLAKGPTGYDATIGDWWWAVADPAGTPIAQSNVLQVGRLESCHGCHIPRANDDYMFGFPRSTSRAVVTGRASITACV